MKILISCLYYENPTGSELYIFELAHELLNRGHQVTVHASEIGGVIFNETDPRIRVSPRSTPRETPDIVLAQHHTFSQELIENTDAPVVYTCHSEMLQDEFPVFTSNKIKKYIAVRDEIKDFMVQEYAINPDNITVIPNGVNMGRFHPFDDPKEFVLIPANVTQLRMPFMERLINEYPDERLAFVGFGTNLIPDKPNVERYESCWKIEDFYKKAKWVAGLFKGRTQWEAWACGLEFKAYNWDGTDFPCSRPDNFEEIYSLTSVVNRLEEVYNEVLNS